MIYRTVLQFSLHFLPTIFEVCSNDVTALQNTTRPGVTGISIRSGKLALWMVEILMQDFSIAFDRDAAIPAISDCNATFFACAHVVIGCVEPFVGMLVESCDEDRFFRSFLGIKFVTP